MQPWDDEQHRNDVADYGYGEYLIPRHVQRVDAQGDGKPEFATGVMAANKTSRNSTTSICTKYSEGYGRCQGLHAVATVLIEYLHRYDQDIHSHEHGR